MMKISHILGATALSLSSMAATAATVWSPTNEDVDFLQFDFLEVTTNGGILGLFDESDFGGEALIIGSNGGQVEFSAAGGSDWTAAFSLGGSITLSGDRNFVLGMSWDRGTTWYEDSASGPLDEGSADSYLIAFNGIAMDMSQITGKTIAVDLNPSAVPVPAAVWLFGTGLIGLVGIARRRA